MGFGRSRSSKQKFSLPADGNSQFPSELQTSDQFSGPLSCWCSIAHCVGPESCFPCNAEYDVLNCLHISLGETVSLSQTCQTTVTFEALFLQIPTPNPTENTVMDTVTNPTHWSSTHRGQDGHSTLLDCFCILHVKFSCQVNDGLVPAMAGRGLFC